MHHDMALVITGFNPDKHGPGRMMDLKGSFSRGNALRLARLRAMETTGGILRYYTTGKI